MCSLLWALALVFSYMDTHSQDFETVDEKSTVSVGITHLAALEKNAIL